MAKKNNPNLGNNIKSNFNSVKPLSSQPPVVKEDKKIELNIEEYKPFDHSHKYPEKEKPKNQYKILASRNDYVKLQEEVIKHLSEGWELVGGVSNSVSVGPYESVTVFTQAVKK